VRKSRILPASGPPSEQEIRDYLAGLNRTEQGCLLTSDSVRFHTLAINNYRRWFSQHGIAIYQEPKTLIWQLGKASNEEATSPDDPKE
jgi:hypothetical protein